MVRLVRYGLPAVILVAGIVALVVGDGGAATGLGVVLVGIAGLVVLVNLFARMSIASNEDREREERARQRYSKTGRWTPRSH